MTDQNAQRYAQTIVLADFDVLEEYLMGMNEEGIHPDLPFIDAHGNASIAHGMAPSGDDWAVGYEAPRDPDSGVPHCCYCLEHRPVDCDAGATWEPTFPVTALVRVEGAQTTPVSTPSGPSAEGCTCWPENDGHDGDCGIWGKPRLEGQDATQETPDATEAAQRRVERYASTIAAAETRDGALGWTRHRAARAVIDVADQEQAELRRRVEVVDLWEAASVRWQSRAEDAEARVVELEALLRSMANDFGWVPDPTAGTWSVNQLRAILDAPKDATAP